MDPKWTGTAIDRREMKAMELKQVVRRNFGTLSMFGFASTLLCSWETMSATIGVSLSNGGTAALFWNYMIVAVGLGFIYASIAELGSMFPTSGGQYFWVAVLAPRKYRRYMSYITGWLCAITWQTAVGGSTFIAATMIQGLFVLNNPNYAYKNWHGSLLDIAFLLLTVVFNTVLVRRLPLVEGLLVFFHILGVLIFIPVWVLSPLRKGGAPLTEYYNPGGWSSNGVAAMVGMAGPLTALIGFDCSVHMAEEAKDSSRTVPFTLLAGYTSNVVLGFFALVACIYTIGPLDTSLVSATGYPVIDIFHNATNSLHATNAMTAILVINFCASAIASLAAASRQLWAFARNGGVPLSHFFAPEHLPFDIPILSICFSLTIPILIALINIRSAYALGIILSIFNSALLASYLITIGCVLLHRLQGRRLPKARYSLGKWGTPVNCLALVFILPIFVFSFFPDTTKPPPISMNWAVVMVGGPILLATVYYVAYGRTRYTPPDETVEDFLERYEATSEEQNGAAGDRKVMDDAIAESVGATEKQE